MKNWKLYIWRVLEGIAIIITIFITPAALYFQYQSLQEQKILGAWQLITTKAKGNSGKIQALEFLNSKGVPLVGVDLSKAYLSGVNLKGANLQHAHFELTDLTKANFEGADLRGANFEGADLRGANFEGADSYFINFTRASLRKATFTGANFTNARYHNCDLSDANFTRANLSGADFTRADLSDANFEGADLIYAHFTDANLSGAKFRDTSKLETAKLEGVFISKYSPTLPTPPEGYEFVISKTPSKDGKIFIELIKTKNLTT